ncbi:phosphoribosylformylglycinamidine synthase subunit PurQ, partial [Bartonella sp. AA81SXKL]|uniref:phosphoribosylformylglycinamidine synthase subunit PurQ n=1 Tax=Bartonella sp. AA81SXKL TaxID=3243438 RepID=UPI0035CEA405
DLSRFYYNGRVICCPVAHRDGKYFVDCETLKQMDENEQIIFRYAENTNPNGSVNDIAGIINKAGNILGMMPHPENFIEPAHGGTEGR